MSKKKNSENESTTDTNEGKKQVVVSEYTHGLLKWMKQDLKIKTKRIFGSIDEMIVFIIKDIAHYDVSGYESSI